MAVSDETRELVETLRAAEADEKDYGRKKAWRAFAALADHFAEGGESCGNCASCANRRAFCEAFPSGCAHQMDWASCAGRLYYPPPKPAPAPEPPVWACVGGPSVPQCVSWDSEAGCAKGIVNEGRQVSTCGQFAPAPEPAPEKPAFERCGESQDRSPDKYLGCALLDGAYCKAERASASPCHQLETDPKLLALCPKAEELGLVAGECLNAYTHKSKGGTVSCTQLSADCIYQDPSKRAGCEHREPEPAPEGECPHLHEDTLCLISIGGAGVDCRYRGQSPEVLRVSNIRNCAIRALAAKKAEAERVASRLWVVNDNWKASNARVIEQSDALKQRAEAAQADRDEALAMFTAAEARVHELEIEREKDARRTASARAKAKKEHRNLRRMGQTVTRLQDALRARRQEVQHWVGLRDRQYEGRIAAEALVTAWEETFPKAFWEYEVVILPRWPAAAAPRQILLDLVEGLEHDADRRRMKDAIAASPPERPGSEEKEASRTEDDGEVGS